MPYTHAAYKPWAYIASQGILEKLNINRGAYNRNKKKKTVSKRAIVKRHNKSNSFQGRLEGGLLPGGL